MASRSADTFAQ